MSEKTLQGRTIYIPQMPIGATRCMAAAFQSIGYEAQPAPDSNAETLELGSKYTSGDECLPERITLGDFLKVTQQPGFDPKKVAFFMPTAGGPCRYGQYQNLLKKVLHDLNLDDILVFSPSSGNSYAGIGNRDFIRTGWRALVVADALLKMRHKTRPYEVNKGQTDEVYERSLKKACETLARPGDHKTRMGRLTQELTVIRDHFRSIPVHHDAHRPLIGIVGEIFCRNHDFSNDNLILKVEEHGGEVWLSDLTEWIWYTLNDERLNLILHGKRFSKSMLGNRIRKFVQRSDEHAIFKAFHEDLKGYEEAEDITEVLDYSEPYLPVWGALGEMVLSVGKAIYLYQKGADGIIDISPFTCMNGIICEAIYPKVSKDHENIPIRNFYFDGTAVDLDRDVGIFIELARNYQRKKSKPGRVRFPLQAAVKIQPLA
jgi:predicted nucleotide-binding protein (sugar kinase/HSP70/actin superfamily)